MKLDLSLKDLRSIAKFIGMRNYSRLNKQQLVYVLELYFETQENKQYSPVLNEERLRANSMERYYRDIYN
ncbi:Rho termination factor N-terminal domain-containing protein [bacterium]|jgi:hypothetical protein|nr:Rho termination factor N-terminal domain-containing protein [bacterium]